MDPFTERMLERARARRHKLNAQLTDMGLDAKSMKKPLQVSQSISRNNSQGNVDSKVFDEKIASEVNEAQSESNIADSVVTEEYSDKNKENKEAQEANVRSSARSRLKRLGALYSNNSDFDDPNEMPSPIHRAELKGYVEKEFSPVKKPQHTVERLAALASDINHWEDDLSHPKVTKTDDKVIQQKSLPNTSQNFTEDSAAKSTHFLGTSKSPAKTSKPEVTKTVKVVNCSPKQSPQKPPRTPTTPLVWDRQVLANLESQGFRPSNSGSRLVYDYANPSPQGPGREGKDKQGGCGPKTNDDKISQDKELSTPTTPTRIFSPKSGSSVDNKGAEAKQLTPKKQALALGSVLHRAALFESPTKSPKTPMKDPAELTVAERKALFEKNKGQALIPKAAFSMAVPAKQLASSPNKAMTSPSKKTRNSKVDLSAAKVSKISAPELAQKTVAVESVKREEPKIDNNIPSASNKVMDRCNIFERGQLMQKLENDILKNVKTERQKELEMLANRWNKQKEVHNTDVCHSPAKNSNHSAMSSNYHQPSQTPRPPPPPPPLPSSGVLPSKPPVHPLNKESPLSPKSPKLPAVSPHAEKISSLASLKKIKVSPAKPGCMYPSLSDIDATESEMEPEESEGENESFGDLESSDRSSSGNESLGVADTSFGREIFQAAGIENGIGKKRGSDILSRSERDAFDEMDELLDEAIANECLAGGPTPPKRRSGDNTLSPSKASAQGYLADNVYSTPMKSYDSKCNEEDLPTHVVDGDQHLPLMHTISFYRKQQAQGSRTPARQVVHADSNSARSARGNSDSGANSDQTKKAVQDKIKSLLDEVCRQQTIISQASQALNLCSSTVEFSESKEQVEGERLLLVATHRRQAALNEIQRLKVEGTLWPKQSPDSPDAVTLGLEKGDLGISGINLPLKKEFIQRVANGEDDFTHHFVCLIKHQENVICTEMLSTENLNRSRASSLLFKNNICLSGLYSDFKVTLEIYGLQVRKEVLSHEAKYHIRKDNSKIRITPKKILKQESKLIMPIVQSPAGPSAVRSTAFSLTGYVIFSLRELSRTQWTLNKVPYSSPLEGSVQMKLNCLLEQKIEERGFLTMFDDVSGFGAWHRRWCVLHEDKISFWKYPEDERKKEPIGWINLNVCSTESVGPVARYICARPNTFLLETRRAARPEDRDTLVIVTSSTHTTIRHLLSADSKEERQMWCSQINKALRSLRAWGPKV